MYISGRAIAVFILALTTGWVFGTGPLELYLLQVSGQYDCNILRSFQDRHISVICLWVFVGQFGYVIIGTMLVFISILMCCGHLMCDILTSERDVDRAIQYGSPKAKRYEKIPEDDEDGDGDEYLEA